MIDTPRPDPFANDPFFKAGPNSNWNACIGRQGHEIQYVDGYIEAAIELADTVIGKGLYGQRDTVVLPMLYNARHGVELVLKFATERLLAAGVVKDDGYQRNHDIRVLWERLDKAGIGDAKLVAALAGLKPFIDSLCGIDDDGQELRYHENRDNSRSLEKYALANLEVVRASLDSLKRHMDDLKFRTLDYIDERTYGTTTKFCSRADLVEIAHILPPRDQWGSEAFTEAKAAIRQKLGIGNKQFSLALDALKDGRELGAIIGVETPLLHITDEEVVRTVERWRRLHPPRTYDPNHLGLDYNDFEKRFSDEAIKEMRERHDLEQTILGEIETDLSPEAFAELEAMFYFGRDPNYGEEHAVNVAQVLTRHVVEKNRREAIRHLIEKTSLLQNLQRAAPKLGRIELGKRLGAFAPQPANSSAVGA